MGLRKLISEDKVMIFEKVRDALAKQFEIDPETITPDTNLIDDLGADSLDVVELIMSVEDEFGIVIDDEAASGLLTVRQIVDYIEKLQ
jgi:acyl carrier protein